MAKTTLVSLAEKWMPDAEDPYGGDQRRLVEFLLQRAAESKGPISIDSVLREVGFERTYSKSSFQQNLLGPLRKDDDVFVGTSSTGIYLITSPDEADQTLGFYTTRVRQELRHARNLRKLAKRVKLFAGYSAKTGNGKSRTLVFLDESGNPDVENLTPPVFVVSAVLIDSPLEVAALGQRFSNACTMIGRPTGQELRTSGLSVLKHARVLRELSLIDYQWAAVCFFKSELNSPGFADPKTFYRYAIQFLVGEVLTIAWNSQLVLDEYSGPAFQEELVAYLKDQNAGLPVARIDQLTFNSSSKERLVQLADLIAGAVRRASEGDGGPLEEITDKQLLLQMWPPRSI